MYEFQDTAAHNRIQCLMYTYLALFDKHSGSADHLLPLFSSTEFSIQLPSGSIMSTEAELREWFEKIPQRVSKAAHTVENLRIELDESQSEQFTLEFEVAWSGVSTNGDYMTGRTHHRWTVAEEGGHLPAIRRIAIESLVPFAPAEGQFVEGVYQRNRTLGLVYRWYSLLDRVQGSSLQFVQLLADDGFEMVYPQTTFTTKEQVMAWLNGAPPEMRNSHRIEIVNVQADSDSSTWTAEIQLHWQNIKADGTFQEMPFHYRWTIQDGEDRFAQVKHFWGAPGQLPN